MLPTESNLYMLLILTVPLQKDTNNVDLFCCFLNVVSASYLSSVPFICFVLPFGHFALHSVSLLLPLSFCYVMAGQRC